MERRWVLATIILNTGIILRKLFKKTSDINLNLRLNITQIQNINGSMK